MKKQILKYFIEVLIIIVGIIIAFYFTKYGERLNRNQDEKEVLNQIYFELQDNLIDLKQDMLIHQIGLEANLRVLKFLDTKGPLTDSLVMDFYWLTKDEYIFGNTSGYENLKSFGIGLIKDDYLRNLITLVYNHNFPRLIKGNTLYPDINEFLNPYFKDHFKVNRDTSLKYTLNINDSVQIKYPREIGFGVQKFVGYIPISTEELLADEEFRFLINKTLEYRLYKFQFYQRCIENVKKTIEQIELSN